MKNANRLLKLTLVITAVLFMYWLNPYLLIKDKERYLWNSVGYESYKFFSFFRVDLARYLNAEGTYRDDSGNSALYIAVYFNNKNGVSRIIDMYDCNEILKSMKKAEEKGYFDLYKYLLSEFNAKCGQGINTGD